MSRLVVAKASVHRTVSAVTARDENARHAVRVAAADGQRTEALGVLATGLASIHQALELSQRSSDVVLFLNTVNADTVPEPAWSRLRAAGVRVVAGVVEELSVGADQQICLRLRGGRRFSRSSVVVGSPVPTVVAPLGRHTGPTALADAG